MLIGGICTPPENSALLFFFTEVSFLSDFASGTFFILISESDDELRQCLGFVFLFSYTKKRKHFYLIFFVGLYFRFFILTSLLLNIFFLWRFAFKIKNASFKESLFVCFFLAFKYKIKFLNQNASLMIKVWSQLELGLQIKYCKHVFLYDFFGFFNNKYNIYEAAEKISFFITTI